MDSMNRTLRQLRGAVTAPLAALMLTLSVAVPLVERADLSHAPAVESEHQPDSCPKPHDHSVCMQLRASHAAPAGRVSDRAVDAVRRVRAVASSTDSRDARSARARSARAPPAR